MWPCYRLIKEEWCDLAQLSDGSLSFDDVDKANIALNCYEDAITRARRNRKKET